MSEPKKDAPKSALPKKGGRIRPVSRSTNFASVRNLKCFKELHKKLVDEGVSGRIVAAWVQDDRNEMTNMTPASLVNLLTEYRMSIPATKRAGPLNVVFEKSVAEVKAGLNELDEMHRLYKIQMDRVGIDFKTEQNIKKLLPSMTQEIRTAREILASAAQLKMDLGINDRKLGTMNVDATLMADVATRYADNPGVAKVLDSSESRRKVLAIAERLLSIAERSDRNPEFAEEMDALSDDAVPGDLIDMPVTSKG